MFQVHLVFSCILLFLLGFTTAQNEVIVNTTKGQIRGEASVVQTSLPRIVEERIISKFLGVPYAKPPVGNLRFQLPSPHDRWDGVRNATRYGKACSQMITPGMEALGYLPGPYGDEDCLFLNVFVPGELKNITEPLSVMVWIYGGRFIQGFSHLYDPTEMVLHGNVIVVTFNYRVGAFGFLSIGESSSTSSNNALRDQIMVLTWVRDNIANFGGNPKEMTVFGQSAGSISVSLLLVSPLSKGLFQRAIAQSGAHGTLLHTTCHGKEQRNYASKSLVPGSSCTSSNISETVACLKNASKDTILAHQFHGDSLASFWDNQFIPCYGDDVIPRKPSELTKSGQIYVDEVIIGGNNDDGVVFFNPFVPVNKTKFENTVEYLIKTFYPMEWERVNAAVLHEYSPYDKNMYARQLVNAQTDRYLADIQILADDISLYNRSVYHYIFNYSPKAIPIQPNWITGGHAEEVFLEMINVVDLNITLPPTDVEVATILLTAFTNFAKTGDPNYPSIPVEWPKYDGTHRKSLEIAPNMTSDNVKSNPRRKAMDFWNNLVPLLAEPDVCPAPTTELPVTTVAPPSDCLMSGCVSDVIVNTTNGQLRGHIFLAKTDGIPKARRITKFLGIPYAKPPAGVLRFADPVKTDSWDGVRNATTLGEMCPQLNTAQLGLGLPAGSAGNEDCLSLNIYIPGDIDVTTEPLSVMVWIHGGGFLLGAGSQYDSTQLALHGKVIVLTINYRLGIFGRISTDGTYANNYLKDQILALKWVQENIANFGGNPSNVTIFGESAGGISVNYLLVSPLANGLFQRAISQSAVMSNVLPSPEKCIMKQYLKSLAKRVGCTYEPMPNIDCLRSASQDSLVNYQLSDNYGEFIIDITDSNWSIVPLCYGDDALPQNPIDMFKAGKMHNSTESVMIGGNNDEGTLVVNTLAPVNKTTFQDKLSVILSTTLLPNYGKFLPIVLHQYSPYSEHQMYNRQAVDGVSDKILAEFQNVADAISSYDYQPKVYHYIYSHTPTTHVDPAADWVRAGHGDEIFLEFGNVLDPNIPIPASESDKETSRFLMTLFTNYAKTGNPNLLNGPYAGVTWPLYNATTRYTLEITDNITSDSVKSHPRRKGMEFWNVIIPSLYELTQCPSPNTTTVQPNPTVPDDSCQVSVGTLSLSAEQADQLLWGLGLSLGFMVIISIILIVALIKSYRDRKSVDI